MQPPGDATLPADAELAATLRLGEKSRGWRGRWLLAAALAFLLLAGGGGYYGYRLVRGRAPQFQTAPATRGDLTVLVTATGTLKPVSQVDVGAEISGRIESVPADFNQHVKKGEPLAELDTRQLRAQVERSQASLEVAEAAVKLAQATLAEMRSNLTRSEELAKAKLVSEQEVDTTRAAFGRAEANIASAMAQVSAATAVLNADRTNLEKAVVRSPIDGMVIARKVEPGQTVAASFQTPILFQLAEDLARMELHVDVDEADMGLVKEGQEATFTVDAYQTRHFPARILSLRNDPHTVQGVVSYEAVLEVDNAEGLLRPGMTATASIVTETRKDALLVPNGALRFTPPNAKLPKSANVEPLKRTERENHVWTLRNGKPEAIAMKKGVSDGRSTEVLSGEITPGLLLLIDVVEKTK
ncbi:MAG TPA: efflux RND transporter periplasmic adaptor subunit [Chthoniobacteraceae bacterium]|jgi:HlyD family secretion protein|nr:efflux RND transporter periplasmic adaptor subunit [Chthoniobacteraceae bacterium]